MGFNNILDKKFGFYIDQVGDKTLRFPWENREAYAAWLAQTYYIVRHTTSLVCLSALQFGAQDREHHYQMLSHLADERGHDLLALNDLQNLGYDLAQFPELPETSVFYQNQYYMIQYQGPASHLGYSLCLEGLAARYSGPVLKKITKLYGKECCTFIDVHANVDQDHFASGVAELKNLTEAQGAAVLKNLEQSTWLYGQILERVSSTASTVSRLAKQLGAA